jgi:outer membrane protein TolC
LRHGAAAAHRRADALSRPRADLESAIRVEVRTAWLNVQETTRHIQVAEEAIGLAEENLRVAGHRYTSGTGTAREVLDAESLWTESERNFSNARYDSVLEMRRLRKDVGEL